MSWTATAGLGGVAGATIYLGLPLGRVGRVDDRLRVALAMFSVGILAFIFMDVAGHGEGIVSAQLNSYKAGTGGIGTVIGLFALMAAGFTIGTAGISTCESRLRAWLPARAARRTQTVALDSPTGEDAVAIDGRRQALQTGMTIAVAIGLHNFAEGLAIGVSAKAGTIGLATVLVIGFALHNATEGFGIVGPLRGVRPPWTWLGAAGLIAGGPTFIGSIVGYAVKSNRLQLCFYALAAGAILYVAGEIWSGMRRYGFRTLGLYMLAAGFLTGMATDLVVSYGGG